MKFVRTNFILTVRFSYSWADEFRCHKNVSTMNTGINVLNQSFNACFGRISYEAKRTNFVPLLYQVIRIPSQFTTVILFKGCRVSWHPYSFIQRGLRFTVPFNYGVLIWYPINKILFWIDEFRPSDVPIWYIWSCDEFRRALLIFKRDERFVIPFNYGVTFRYSIWLGEQNVHPATTLIRCVRFSDTPIYDWVI